MHLLLVFLFQFDVTRHELNSELLTKDLLAAGQFYRDTVGGRGLAGTTINVLIVEYLKNEDTNVLSWPSCYPTVH